MCRISFNPFCTQIRQSLLSQYYTWEDRFRRQAAHDLTARCVMELVLKPGCGECGSLCSDLWAWQQLRGGYPHTPIKHGYRYAVYIAYDHADMLINTTVEPLSPVTTD